MRYCCADVFSTPAGHQYHLVHQAGGRTRLLPPQMADLLNYCQTFRTFEEHARSYQQRAAPGRQVSDRVWTESIVEQLTELAADGLLISEQDFLSSLQAADPEPPPSPITTVGIITRNRPEALKRCLISFIENSCRFGRTNDFVVMDDSDDAALRQETRRMLRTLKAEYGVSLSYAGLEEKQRFAEALIAGAELPPDVISFALFDPAQVGFSAGANRNALLLHTVGDLVLSADDDMRCRVTAPLKAEAGLTLVSGDELLDYQFYPDRDSALRAVEVIEQDILAIHEQLLGRSISEAVALSGGIRRLKTDHLRSQLVHRLKTGASRISVTLTGLAGDAGVSSPIQYLLLNPEMHQRIIQSESFYRSVCTSREVVRRVSVPAITDQPWGFQTGAFGFDNRNLLPPFLPVSQGEDGLFGLILHECFTHSFIGHLPQAIFHLPASVRSFAPDSLSNHARHISLISLLTACTISSQGMPCPAEERERLRAMGNYLMQTGKLPLPEFEEYVRRNIWRLQGSFAAVLENRLRHEARTPDYQADDISNYLDNLSEAMTRSDYIIPDDMRPGRSSDEARHLSRQLVYQFGELLYWWSEIRDAARKLRAKGQRLAIPV
ncbi:MAG: hypothetical protein U0Z53_09085 [Blastocatellia bacterium]